MSCFVSIIPYIKMHLFDFVRVLSGCYRASSKMATQSSPLTTNTGQQRVLLVEVLRDIKKVRDISVQSTLGYSKLRHF